MNNILDNFKYFGQIYYNPARAFGNVIDNGSWIFGALAVLVVSLAFQWAVNPRIVQTYAVSAYDYRIGNFERYQADDLSAAEVEELNSYADANLDEDMSRQLRPFPVLGRNVVWFFSFQTNNFLGVLLSLAVFFVPTLILLLTALENIGSFGVAVRRDYAAAAACTLFAWAAAHLPFAVVGYALQNSASFDGSIFLGLWLLSGVYFGVLMTFAVRTVFGAKWSSAVFGVILAAFAINLGGWIFNRISPYLFSPFILIYLFLYFRGDAGMLGNGLRQRQNFRRLLNNSLVNPHDAEARVQLGLLYLQRRQTAEARKHFEKALEIDAREIDANYELGKMLRADGDYQKALERFSIVAEQNDKHSTSEIWREIGATYLDAGAFTEAREFLEKFIERRAFDAEGLYYLGQVYSALGEQTKANETFQSAVESAETSSDFRRREARHWQQLARKKIVTR